MKPHTSSPPPENVLRTHEVRLRFKGRLVRRDGCVEYIGPGRFHAGGAMFQPRKVAWFYATGEYIADKNLLLLCTCKNEACVYAGHLVRGTVENRFWAQVNKGGPEVRPGLGPCWVWTGRRIVKGTAWEYGKINFPTDEGERYGGTRNRRKRIEMMAHRYSWELANGPIGDPSVFVCHRCDNPLCVRPDHLFLGDAKINMQDCIAKGRHAHGDRMRAMMKAAKEKKAS